MALQPGTGTTLSVSASAPVSDTASGFGALTYTKVGKVETVGAGGRQRQEITFVDLETGEEEVFGGTKTFQPRTVTLGEVADDAGQGILETAIDDNATISVKLERPDGSIRYFQARVFSFADSDYSTTSVIRKDCTIRQIGDAVKVAAP